jgi:hypothetical protein
LKGEVAHSENLHPAAMPFSVWRQTLLKEAGRRLLPLLVPAAVISFGAVKVTVAFFSDHHLTQCQVLSSRVISRAMDTSQAIAANLIRASGSP